MEERIIRNQEDHKKDLAERRKKSDARQVREDNVSAYNHFDVAMQIIKVVNATNIDPFVKKVMTMRILAPVTIGKERDHMSIALELGATATEVEEAEAYGIGVIGEILDKVSLPDFIEKFNSERKLANEIKKMQSDIGSGSKNA